MRLLALESAGPRCSVALLEDGVAQASAVRDGAMGHASTLPGLLEGLLDGAALDAVAVGIGPGGFTGLRAGIALAQGLALARSVPLLGVSTGQALAAQAENPARRAVWAVLDSKRGHFFLERPGQPAKAFAERALPPPDGPILLVGDGAAVAAARLLSRGQPVALGGPLLAHAIGVGLAAWAMWEGRLPRGVAEPLYIDPPATT